MCGLVPTAGRIDREPVSLQERHVAFGKIQVGRAKRRHRGERTQQRGRASDLALSLVRLERRERAVRVRVAPELVTRVDDAADQLRVALRGLSGCEDRREQVVSGE